MYVAPTRSQYVTRAVMRTCVLAGLAALSRSQPVKMVSRPQPSSFGPGGYERTASTYEAVHPGWSSGARYQASIVTGRALRVSRFAGCHHPCMFRIDVRVSSSALSNSDISIPVREAVSGDARVTLSIGRSSREEEMARPSFG